MLACGGNQSATNPAKTSPNPITDAAKANMVNYLAHGGRAFAEHYHWAWIKPDHHLLSTLPLMGTPFAHGCG
jgi:hypothetical protein